MKEILIVAMSMVPLCCLPAHAETPIAQSENVASKLTSESNFKQASIKSDPSGLSEHSGLSDHSDHIIGLHLPSPGNLGSSSVLVQDQATGSVLYEKNADAIVPIASISKLMTAMVVLDAHPDLNEELTISEEDVDMLKGTHSRLKVGTRLRREDMLRLALMSSENRAASSLSRHYQGGRPAFVAAMNLKAKELGLVGTHFEDPTGLTSANVSTAHDLVNMVAAAHRYPLIREFTTTGQYSVVVGGHMQQFHNTNSLVRSANSGWDIGLSKTGYINEAGKCLVMQAWFNQKPMIIVLLDSWGRMTRIGDANRIKRWVERYALANKGNTI